MKARPPELSALQVRRILAALRDDLTEDEMQPTAPADGPPDAIPESPDPAEPLYESEDLERARRLDQTPEVRWTFARWQQSLAGFRAAVEPIATPPAGRTSLPETVDGVGLETIARDLTATLALAPDDAARAFIGLDQLDRALHLAVDDLARTRTIFAAEGRAWAAQIGLRGIFEKFFKEHDRLCVQTAADRDPRLPPIIDTQPVWYTTLPLPPRAIHWLSPAEAAGWFLALSPASSQAPIILRAAQGVSMVRLPGSLQRELPLQADHFWALHPGPPADTPALVRGIFRILSPGDAIAAVERFSTAKAPASFESELECLHRLVEWQLFEIARRRIQRLLKADLVRQQRFYLHRLLAGIYKGVYEGLVERLPGNAPEIQWAAERARLYAQAFM